VAIARELTKVFEEVWRGTLSAAASHLAEVEPRGEYVLVLDGAPAPAPAATADVDDALRARLGAGVDKKAAIAEVAAELRVPKRVVYDRAIRTGQGGKGASQLNPDQNGQGG
jgi:16S rRNA (cytidine1402-2'-O)-methyltransferase